MSNYLDLYRLDISLPGHEAEIEATLAIEGMRAPVIDWVMSTIKTLKIEVADLEVQAEKLDDLEYEVEDLKSDVEDLEDDVNRLETQVDKLNRDSEVLQRRIDDRDAEIFQLRKQLVKEAIDRLRARSA